MVQQIQSLAVNGNSYLMGGNVGIGTTGPLSTLDVNGGVAIGSYAGNNFAGNGNLIVSGNVGIGTPTTDQALTVNGNEHLYGSNGNFLSTPYSGYDWQFGSWNNAQTATQPLYIDASQFTFRSYASGAYTNLFAITSSAKSALNSAHHHQLKHWK